VTAISARTAPDAGQAGPPPPFDAELRPLLDSMPPGALAGFSAADIPRLRATASAAPVPTDEELRRGGAFEVTRAQAPGPSGAPDVPLLIVRPAEAQAPVACLYYMHGGGMIMGDYRGGLDTLVDTAAELGIAVISVDYRLAPETPHPGPVEDCYAGLTWVAEHGAELGIDPARLIAGGISAGGCLAAAVALLARDRGGPALIGQWLLCPMLDDRNDTVSARQMAGLGIWDSAANRIGWTALLGDAAGGPDVSPYAAPARAADLSGLPPAFIDVGSAETFRDEDVAYASRIWQAGGQAELHVWPGGSHGFAAMVPQAALSQAAQAAQRDWLRRLLA
jgi:acetyl esterase/lipase